MKGVKYFAEHVYFHLKFIKSKASADKNVVIFEKKLPKKTIRKFSEKLNILLHRIA